MARDPGRGRRRDRRRRLSRGALALPLAVTVAVAFFIAFIVDLVSAAYEIPEALYGLMALVVGWVLAEGSIRRGNGR